MSAVSPQPTASARKLLQVILQRVAKVNLQAVADAIGRDESTACRIVSGESGVRLTVLYEFLKTLDLKIVDARRICIDADQYNALLFLAKKAMSAEQKIDTPPLDWEE